MTDDPELLTRLTVAMERQAFFLQRLVAAVERLTPTPPDRSLLKPAGEEAYSRPSLKDLALWEAEDQLANNQIR